MEDMWSVFDFGLFKKQKAKKKKKTNFIYKVKLKSRIMEKGETYGEQGKRFGPEPIPHSEHEEPGGGVRCWFLLARLGWLEHSVHWQTRPNTERSLALLTPLLRWPREPLPPGTCSCDPAGLCIQRKGLLPQPHPRLFLQFIGIRPYDRHEKPLPPLSYSKLGEDRKKSARDERAPEESQGGGAK